MLKATGMAGLRAVAVVAVTVHIWLMAARPRTLPAAAAPVLVGTAYAATLGTFKPLTFVATLLGALFIQIGTNLSNDYSDARTRSRHRGPARPGPRHRRRPRPARSRS